MKFIKSIASRVFNRFNREFSALFDEQLSHFLHSVEQCRSEFDALNNDFNDLRKMARGMPSTFGIMKNDCKLISDEFVSFESKIEFLSLKMADIKGSLSFFDKEVSDVDFFTKTFDMYMTELNKLRLSFSEAIRDLTLICDAHKRALFHVDSALVVLSRHYSALLDHLNYSVLLDHRNIPAEPFAYVSLSNFSIKLSEKPSVDFSSVEVAAAVDPDLV